MASATVANSVSNGNDYDYEMVKNQFDPELKYLTVDRNNFNDPASHAEWTQKRLVWIPHEVCVTLLCVRFKVVYGLRPCLDGHQPTYPPTHMCRRKGFLMRV